MLKTLHVVLTMSDLGPQTKNFRDRLGLDVLQQPDIDCLLGKRALDYLRTHPCFNRCSRDHKSHHPSLNACADTGLPTSESISHIWWRPNHLGVGRGAK